MNREEAAAVLDDMIFGTYPDDDITIEKIEMEAVRFAIAALRSPERDPDTGAKDAFSLRMTAIRRFIGIRTECTPESKATGSGCIIGTNQSKTPPEVEE